MGCKPWFGWTYNPKYTSALAEVDAASQQIALATTVYKDARLGFGVELLWLRVQGLGFRV